jgi:hypothetical protein
MEKYAPDPVPPEFRLELTIIASPFFAISFFWFAWTSFPTISFAVPMMSGLILGWSLLWIFVSHLFAWALKSLLINILMHSWVFSTISLTRTRLSLRLLLLRPLYCVVLLELRFRCSRHKCTTNWIHDGHQHWSDSSRWLWCRYLLSS